MVNNKFFKILIFGLLLTLYACFLISKVNLPAADDLPRQIKIGEELVHGNFEILYKNTFSYTEPDHTFYNHHWLSTIIFYTLHQIIGWGGLVIFKVIILLTAFSIIFLTALKKANFWLVASLSVPTILIMQNRSDLRPEIFSYLFIAIYLYLLTDLDEYPNSKKIFWLIPLQLLWVNMHVFFSIGIMITAGFLFERFVLYSRNLKNNPSIRRLAIILVALILISFINPRGIEGVLYQYPSNFQGQISENFSISDVLRQQSRWEDISVGLFGPLAIFLLLSFILNFRRKPIFYFFASIATIILTYNISRSIFLFGIILLPALSYNLSPAFYRASTWGKRYPIVPKLGIAALISGLLYFAVMGANGEFLKYKKQGIGLAPYSNSAAIFFKDQNLKGPIFNDPDIGSYLIYHLYPYEKIFSDNRFADAYSPELFNGYDAMLQNEKSWQEGLTKYNFNVIFFYAYDQGSNLREFLYRRVHDPDWALIHADKFNVILVKNIPDNQEIIKNFLITKDNIEESLGSLLSSSDSEDLTNAADLFNLLDRQDLSMRVYIDVTNRWPDQGKVWLIMSILESRKTDPASRTRGLVFAQKAIDSGWKVPQSYTYLSIGYLHSGQVEKAREAAKKALAIDPQNAEAEALLNYINTR